jgi:dienelactone hydrolase
MKKAILIFTTFVLFGAQELFAIQDLNTPRTFPKIESKAEWQTRAKEIREQVLVSCGLWPMPQKTLLRAKVFGKIVRDGYSIEKVYFQSYPGVYVAGNLYRPLGQGKFPAILNPHGHWENGRMADTNTGSIAARCINFAKQGMIAFSYDMAGYNDTFFPDHGNVDAKDFYKRHRRFATNEINLLWNINLMGLQTWNSIRALDFLESLPDVDKSRLACTGASGGGTQTFILGAIDDRLATQAPVVMVSHSMQGGCSCENAPGLRIEYSNMEIAAAAAPRPQIMIGATGDWTKTMMRIEGPAVESVYHLFNAENRLRYAIFDFPHNYNQTSREVVYDFFGKTLKPVSPSGKEVEYKKEADEILRVFPDGKLPGDAKTESELIDSLRKNSLAQIQSLKPESKKSLEEYKKVFEPAWQHTLQLQNLRPLSTEIVYLGTDRISPGPEAPGGKESIPAILFSPEKSNGDGIVIMAHPKGKSFYVDEKRNLNGLAKSLVERGFKVLILNFPTAPVSSQNQADLFFTTYNRTFAQERVRDLASACEWVKKSGNKAILCGAGRAGLWSLLAAPVADVVIADCDTLNTSSDAELLEPDLFIPGLRKIGAFEGVATLAAPHPILLHNTGETFSVGWLKDVYGATKAKRAMRVELQRLEDNAIAEFLNALP